MLTSEQSLRYQVAQLQGEVERQQEAHNFWFWFSMQTLLGLIILTVVVEFGGTKCS